MFASAFDFSAAVIVRYKSTKLLYRVYGNFMQFALRVGVSDSMAGCGTATLSNPSSIFSIKMFELVFDFSAAIIVQGESTKLLENRVYIPDLLVPHA